MLPDYHRIDLPAVNLQRFSARVTERAAERQLYYFTYCEFNYGPARRLQGTLAGRSTY